MVAPSGESAAAIDVPSVRVSATSRRPDWAPPSAAQAATIPTTTAHRARISASRLRGRGFARAS